VEIILSQDHAGINAGSIFIRNTPLMKLFIDIWSDALIVERVPPWTQREQDALTYLIVKHPALRERIGFVRQRLINAFPIGIHMWTEGELLVHFAGCWYARRKKAGLM
jgi:galactosyl transferase GMA12/MNN10 family